MFGDKKCNFDSTYKSFNTSKCVKWDTGIAVENKTHNCNPSVVPVISVYHSNICI